MTLEKQFNEICQMYLEEFCEKNQYFLEDNMWVAGDVGTIYLINEMYLNFDDIRYEIDNGIERFKLEQWYYFTVDLALENKPIINFKNWLKL